MSWKASRVRSLPLVSSSPTESRPTRGLLAVGKRPLKMERK